MINGYRSEIKNSLIYWQKHKWPFFFYEFSDHNSWDKKKIACSHCGGRTEIPWEYEDVPASFLICAGQKSIFLKAKSSQKSHFPHSVISDEMLMKSIQIDYHSHYYYTISHRNDTRAAYMLSADELDELKSTTKLKTKMPWSELGANSLELTEIEPGIWDLQPLLMKIVDYKVEDITGDRGKLWKMTDTCKEIAGKVEALEGCDFDSPLSVEEAKGIGLSDKVRQGIEWGLVEAEDDLNKFLDNNTYGATGSMLKLDGWKDEDIKLILNDMQLSIKFLRSKVLQ